MTERRKVPFRTAAGLGMVAAALLTLCASCTFDDEKEPPENKEPEDRFAFLRRDLSK